MRIVLLNQYYLPDEAPTARFSGDVGTRLADDGHEVTVVCSRRCYTDPTSVYARRETIAGVDVRRSWGTGFGRAGALGRLLDYATFLLAASGVLAIRGRPDVVVSLTAPPMVALPGLLMARLRSARFVYWVMDLYPDLAFALGVISSRSLVGRVLDRLSRYVMRQADDVVALGDTMAELVRQRGARRVTVVHNWADGDLVRPRPIEGHPLRRRWGWQDRFVVLYSGNMGMAHEFDTILEAAQALMDRPEVLFAFVGGGPRRKEVEREARRRGLTNVEFRPYLPHAELALGLTSGDVHLTTLRPEVPGMLVPSKIYGILAAGRPTLYVGPDRGEIADILRQAGCGCRLAIGDAAGLVAEVLSYLDNPDRRAAEGVRAREAFDTRYDRERAVTAFSRMFDGR